MQIREVVAVQAFDDIFKRLLRVGVFDPIGGREGREPQPHTLTTPDLCHSIQHFEQQPRAVFHTATIGVIAFVAAGFQELIQQIAISPMHFDPVETGLFGHFGGMGVVRDQTRHLIQIQRARL